MEMSVRPQYKSLIIRIIIPILCVATCGAIGASHHHTLLTKVGVFSALHKMGVIADPDLQSKIDVLSRQIESLQSMVTKLVPAQQETIEKLQREQQLQLQLIQAETDRRAAEAEQKRLEEEAARQREEVARQREEARRREEERIREEEKQKAMELEMIRELEEKKRQLELFLKQEEERKRLEEEARLERERVEEDSRQRDNGDSETRETCTDGSCSAHWTAEPAQEEWTTLREEISEERRKLGEEMRQWSEQRARVLRNVKRRIAQRNEVMDSVAERERIQTEQIDEVRALSEQLALKVEELHAENTALRFHIETLEGRISESLGELTSQITSIKQQMEEDSDRGSETTASSSAEEVQSLINHSLKKYDADNVGMPDYALESSGAVVFTIGDTEPYTKDTPWMGVFGISIWRSCKTPRLAIQKDNSPGNCWSFAGDKGTLTIQLSAQVFPEYFTMDHIPLELAPHGNATSAPHHFRVLGLDYGNAPKGHVLGIYEFTEFPLQTFAVQQNPYEKYFRFIKVEILSNHGNKDYTCLYRFRVHGVPHDTDTYNG